MNYFKKCSKCDGIIECVALLSHPPQYKYICNKCGEEFRPKRGGINEKEVRNRN